MTWAKLLNSNSDKDNLIKKDFEIIEYPDRLTDNKGLQYPSAAIYRFSDQENVDLFGLYKYEMIISYDKIDEEIEEIYTEKYYIENTKLVEKISKRNKSQEEIDQILKERQEKSLYEEQYGYRELRKIAYINQLSPERDAISTLGDVVDALYQAIWKGDASKLEELSFKIEDIKSQFPKPE